MAFLLLLWPGTKASAGPPPPPPPLPDANVNCAYATEDLTTVYATEDGSAVYAPAACFLPGAQGGVGWPDDKVRRKIPRKLFEKLLKQQRDNTFGRRWFAEFEEAQRKLANDNLAIAAREAREVVEQIESTDTLDLHHDRVNEIAAALQAAAQVKSTIDAIAAANFAIAKAWALREWIAELERDDEDLLWLFI